MMPFSESTQSIRGRIRSITGTDPAAGAEVSETVPVGAKWRLISFSVTLVTAVAAANRSPALIIDDGTNILYYSTLHAVQTASLTRIYQYAQGSYWVSAADANGVYQDGLPGLYLMPGWRIRTLTTNIQAADNWGAPQYSIEEYVEP
jgi:hypothetical protein